ncbi:MAG: hypothetical protein CBB71_03440 [Rhodopirellula sp. TMED11]|nr:MAG: hypothetical protein CBB71_03440 [Rhodopirellula sp. TMED11]
MQSGLANNLSHLRSAIWHSINKLASPARELNRGTLAPTKRPTKQFPFAHFVSQPCNPDGDWHTVP